MGNNKGASGSGEDEQKADAWFNSYDSARGVKVYADEENKQRIKKEMFKNISAEINGARVRKLQSTFLRVAAILLLVSGAGLLTYLYQSNNQPTRQDITWNTFSANNTTPRTVLLADSSTVVLKPGASVSIPSNFNQSARVAKLIDGEAFFEVKRNPAKPFVVQSGTLRVKVLGTAFTVYDNKTAGNKQVAVAHGLVQVSDDLKVLSLLTKGKQLTYQNANRVFNVAAVAASIVGIWSKKQVELEQVSFSQLAQTFKGFYNTELSATDERIKSAQFTLTIYQKLPASATLRIIAKTHGLNFYKKDGKIVLTRQK